MKDVIKMQGNYFEGGYIDRCKGDGNEWTICDSVAQIEKKRVECALLDGEYIADGFDTQIYGFCVCRYYRHVCGKP